MARQPKTPFENKPADDSAGPSPHSKLSAPELKKKSRTTATLRKKKNPSAAKKSSTKRPSASKHATSRPAEPTDEEIRLRAYFLAERRQKLSLPGDSAHDWIEARRQLIEEASH